MANATTVDRARAYRLRAKLRRGDALESEDAEWLDAYEKAKRGGGDDAGAGDFGASASSRTIHVEEKRVAVGTGAAAETAAAAALAREEGRRLDFLVHEGIGALKESRQALVEACGLHREMAATLLARTVALEEVHLSMLETVREQYLARTQAEVDAIQNGSEDGAQNALIEQLARALLPGPPTPRTAKK